MNGRVMRLVLALGIGLCQSEQLEEHGVIRFDDYSDVLLGVINE